MTADLIVFGEDWGRHPSSTQHLVRYLAQSRKIIYVNSIGLRRPRFDRKDLARIVAKLRAVWSNRGTSDTKPGLATETVPDNVTILAPLAVPWPGNRVAGWLNRQILGRTIRRAMQRRGIRRPVLWASLPTAVDFAGALDERAVVYYCGDDFGALDGVDHAPVLRLERRLVALSRLIFAVSPMLYARFPADKTKLLTHGVDLDLFTTPTQRARDLPTGKTAGYYGNLCERVDQDLLVTLARSLPDWTIVLIGNERVAVDRLRREPNIRLLGPRTHADLPAYVQHWGVSLLPFLNTAMVRASNPLKLREYLAAGQPVVSTPMPALEPYLDLISVAAGGVDFAAAVAKAGAARSGAEARRERVGAESWQVRGRETAALIDAL